MTKVDEILYAPIERQPEDVALEFITISIPITTSTGNSYQFWSCTVPVSVIMKGTCG